MKLQLERSWMVFEIENECNTYGRWFKFFPVHPKQDTISRVEKKTVISIVGRTLEAWDVSSFFDH